MNNIVNNEAREALAPNELLKVTALLYLEEALEREAYEECRELAASARAFGAKPEELKGVLYAFLRGKAGPREAQGKNRLNQLKGK